MIRIEIHMANSGYDFEIEVYGISLGISSRSFFDIEEMKEMAKKVIRIFEPIKSFREEYIEGIDSIEEDNEGLDE